MKHFVIALVCLGAVWLSGCATAPPVPDATTIQGTWKGQEFARGAVTTDWLTLTGNELEFHGANHNEWYRGTFTLNENTQPKQFIAVITQSPQSEYVGKTGNAVYELRAGPGGVDTLVITGNEPGNPQMPSGLSDHRARQIVFKRD